MHELRSIHLQIEFVVIRKKWFEIELRIKKRVACLYGVIIHDGECWENTREACKTRGVAEWIMTSPRRGGGLLHHEGTSIPKVTGSNPAVARQVFSLPSVAYTRSSITIS